MPTLQASLRDTDNASLPRNFVNYDAYDNSILPSEMKHEEKQSKE